MIKLKEVEKKKLSEDLSRFKEEDIFEIEGFKKANNLCTVIALTRDLKYIVNTDSCDYYQFKKFNKQDILDIIDDLKQLVAVMI